MTLSPPTTFITDKSYPIPDYLTGDSPLAQQNATVDPANPQAPDYRQGASISQTAFTTPHFDPCFYVDPPW